MLEGLAILAFVLSNAFFEAAQFAIVSAPRNLYESMAEGGDPRSKRVLRILTEEKLQERYLGAAQIGSAATTIGLGMYGEQVISQWLIASMHGPQLPEFAAAHTIAALLSLLLLTYLHIVCGEMLPKAVSLQRSEKLLPWLIVPMTFFMRILRPVVVAINTISRLLLRHIFHIDETERSAPVFTPEEIEFILKESETEGILSDEIGDVIEQLFDFGDRIAADVMVPRVHMTALPMRPPVSQIRRVLIDSVHTRFPVYGADKDDIVGSVHIKELGYLLDAEGECALPLRPIPFVPRTAPIPAVLDAMQEHSTHIAIVLDEYGGTAGLITIQDIFEEVLGEFDEASKRHSIEQLDENLLRANGTARLDELAEHLGIAVEHDEVNSISGLVLDRLNRPPRIGDLVEYSRISIEVVRVKGRGVHTCLVRRLADPEDQVEAEASA